MYVLAVDTSSAAITAAVVEVTDGDVCERATATIYDARAHAEALVPMIQGQLARLGLDVADLGAVVAGVGPGPFTGLRVGLVTAAVLADTLRVPTYGVCSLDAVAWGLTAGPLLVAGDARRREVYWARYVDGVRMAGPAVDRPHAVDAGDAAAMAGAGARLYADVLGLPLLDCDHPSVAGLVGLAAERIRAAAPSETLTPLYLRRPDVAEPRPPKAVTP